METLPDSTLPEELRGLGYEVTEIGEGQRVLATAIEQKFVTGPDGELEGLTTGSAPAVALTMTHAGIRQVKRYTFLL